MCVFSLFCAVTLFELTVVNDWYIIMVSEPLQAAQALSAPQHLPHQRCFLPMAIGMGSVLSLVARYLLVLAAGRHLTPAMLLGTFSGFTGWTNEVTLCSSLSPCCPGCALVAQWLSVPQALRVLCVCL